MSGPIARCATWLVTVFVITTGHLDHDTELETMFSRLQKVEGVADMVVCGSVAGKQNLAAATNIYRSVPRG